MKSPALRLCMAAAISCGLVLMVGCNKKTTQLPPPQPEKPAAQEQAPPPPPEPEKFEVKEDVDAEARAVLQTVYFDYDKFDLRSETIDRLQQVGKFLMQRGSMRILMEGHADERGSSEYNMGLGDKRARAVSQWLVSYGISSNRLETTSYGRERPAFPACGEDESCHAKNRRVEFQVLVR